MVTNYGIADLVNTMSKIQGKTYDLMIIDDLKEPDSGLYPYEMSRDMGEFTFPNKVALPSNKPAEFNDRELDPVYKIKKEWTAEEKQKFYKLMYTRYGL